MNRRMLAKPAANAIADIGIAVPSISLFARCTRRVVATARGEVALVVGINQFTFAFGPSLVGVIRDWSGDYGASLGACTILRAIAAILVLLGPRPQRHEEPRA